MMMSDIFGKDVDMIDHGHHRRMIRARASRIRRAAARRRAEREGRAYRSVPNPKTQNLGHKI